MGLKIIESPAFSEALARRLKGLNQAPLVVLDDNPLWLTLLKEGERSLPWALVQMSPASDWIEHLSKHPQLRSGGWLWSPAGRSWPGLPSGWKVLSPPWAWLGMWLLRALPLQGRHVGLLAPAECALENLVGWLPRQGASLSWCDDNSRHLWNQVRLCDVLVIFPGFSSELEAHGVTAGTILIDLRPGRRGLAGNALSTVLSGYGDASTGALRALLPGLALSQQETLIELA